MRNAPFRTATVSRGLRFLKLGLEILHQVIGVGSPPAADLHGHNLARPAEMTRDGVRHAEKVTNLVQREQCRWHCRRIVSALANLLSGF